MQGMLLLTSNQNDEDDRLRLNALRLRCLECADKTVDDVELEHAQFQKPTQNDYFTAGCSTVVNEKLSEGRSLVHQKELGRARVDIMRSCVADPSVPEVLRFRIANKNASRHLSCWPLRRQCRQINANLNINEKHVFGNPNQPADVRLGCTRTNNDVRCNVVKRTLPVISFLHDCIQSSIIRASINHH